MRTNLDIWSHKFDILIFRLDAKDDTGYVIQKKYHRASFLIQFFICM